MKRVIGILILLIGFASMISASYQIGNNSYSIDKDYGTSDTLKGWINISFNSEPLDSMFSDSFANSVSLRDILKVNPLFSRECRTFNCTEDYEYNNGENETNFVLNKNQSKIIGIVLTENILSVNSAKLTIDSDAVSSCENQLKIDFLDGEESIKNNKSSLDSCETSTKNYSCYDDSKSYSMKGVDKSGYCQKIKLPEAPGFVVGAWVKRVSSDNAELLIRLFKEGESNSLKDCNLYLENGEEGEFSCDLDYLVTSSQEYYLCLYSNSDKTIYQTKMNTNPVTKCGIYGILQIGSTTTSAYSIFAQPKKFDDFGTLNINSYGLEEWNSNFTSLLKKIVLKRYGSLNCTASCVIPLKITSYQDNQSISLNNLEINYKTNSGISIENQFYDLEEIDTKVSSGFQKLFFDSVNFMLPSLNKTYEYSLFFKGNKIIDRANITIGNLPVIKDLNPKSTALGYETKFIANVEAVSGNITSYKWDIDGVKITTPSKEVLYAFQSLGVHNITLSVTDSRGKGNSRTFIINVVSPENQIENDIKTIKERIAKINQNLNFYDAFEKSTIEEILNIRNATDIISDLEIRYKRANNESEFLEILRDLFSINIPESITPSYSANSILFYPKKENINIATIASISSGSYDSEKEEAYKNAVLGWEQQNLDMKINYKKIDAIKGATQENLASIFELTITKKTSWDSAGYLLIKKMDELKFKTDYGQQDLGDYYSINLDSGNEVISFSTKENIEFADLPVFISPEIEKLNVKTTACTNDSDCGEDEICDEFGFCAQKQSTSKWIIFGLAIIILIVAAFIVYVILFKWYKYKYEKHLFSNRNNLFNLVNYINLQKRNGVSEEDIIKKLKKAKWSSEQISYATKKYKGKNTGMFELPFVRMIFGRDKTEGNISGQKQSPVQNRGNFPGSPFKQ